MGNAAFVNQKGVGKRAEAARQEMQKKKLCKIFALLLAKSIEKYQFCGIISMALIVTTFNVMLNC